VNPSGPPPRRSAAAERARLAAHQQFMFRPLRLLVVGKEVVWGWSVNEKMPRIHDVGVSKSVGWPR
jgi:hypothetical protein